MAPEGSQGAGKEGPGSARVWRGQGRPGRRRAEQDTQPRRRSSQASPRDETAPHGRVGAAGLASGLDAAHGSGAHAPERRRR